MGRQCTHYLTLRWGDNISRMTNGRKRPSIQTTALRSLSKRLGRLAVVCHKQDGVFRIRQREHLRRALEAAAEALSWDALASSFEEPIEEIAADVRWMTDAGMGAIERDLDSEIREKKQEVRQLKRTIVALTDLAAQDGSAFPTELAYQYTATQGRGEYVTKEQELLLEDPDSAVKAASSLENRLDRLRRLRDEMVEGLKQRRSSLDEARSDIASFVRGTRPVVREVLATLP